MNKLFGLLAISLVTLTGEAAVQPSDSITCYISGTVVDRPDSKEATIIEAEKDFRIHECITVPIIDGKYSYILRDDMPRVYSVFFDDETRRGSWKIRNFYTGNGYVEIESDNDSNKEDEVLSDLADNILANKIKETLDKENGVRLRELYAQRDSLSNANALFSSDLQNIFDEYANLDTGAEKDSLRTLIQKYLQGPKEKAYSKDYLKCDEEILKLYCENDSLKRTFINETPSLVGLFTIKEALMISKYAQWIDAPEYIKIFETVYADSTMANHPYAQEIVELIKAREVVAGNDYPDYKITRPDGTTEQIASLIKGNVAVIDLWASWCGPCRKHSKELIPLYEKYKDKGFKVIAIAREESNCMAMNEAMKHDGYPWESFVDLGDRDKVWTINGAGNAGGKIILVGSDVKIIGTDLSTEEIANYLSTYYGE